MAANTILSEKQYACLSLTVIATVANHFAAANVGGWCDYWYGVATAATGTSYMFQALLALSRLIERRHARTEVIE